MLDVQISMRGLQCFSCCINTYTFSHMFIFKYKWSHQFSPSKSLIPSTFTLSKSHLEYKSLCCAKFLFKFSFFWHLCVIFSEQIKTWAWKFLAIDLRFNPNVEKERNPGKRKESLIILYMSLFIYLYTWDNFLNKLYNADEHITFLLRKQWFSFTRNFWLKIFHLHKVNNLMIEIKWINNPVNLINKIRIWCGNRGRICC